MVVDFKRQFETQIVPNTPHHWPFKFHAEQIQNGARVYFCSEEKGLTGSLGPCSRSQGHCESGRMKVTDTKIWVCSDHDHAPCWYLFVHTILFLIGVSWRKSAKPWPGQVELLRTCDGWKVGHWTLRTSEPFGRELVVSDGRKRRHAYVVLMANFVTRYRCRRPSTANRVTDDVIQIIIIVWSSVMVTQKHVVSPFLRIIFFAWLPPDFLSSLIKVGHREAYSVI